MKSLLIPALLLGGSLASAQVDSVSPRLNLPAACGVITDLSGVPIHGAEVSVGAGDVDSFVTTDDKGRWGFLSDEKMSGWLEIKAKGFDTERFQFAIKGKSTAACKKPMYIRVVVAFASCPVVTMHAKQGIERQ